MMGRGKREEWKRAFSLFPSCPARFLFFSIITIFTGIPSGSLCGGESNPAATRIHGGKRTNLTTHCSQVLLHIK